jgi:hypothetical protein
MMPEALAPRSRALAEGARAPPRRDAKEKALVEALAKRYSGDPKAERAALDKA